MAITDDGSPGLAAALNKAAALNTAATSNVAPNPNLATTTPKVASPGATCSKSPAVLDTQASLAVSK
ncbi:hypothetical protein PHLCEN_2v265, partial [Hermanssonia centrifuga]